MAEHATWQPNANHEHVFVVLRAETGDADSIAERVTATRAFFTKEEAEKEVARLTEINADKGCEYFWTVARLPKEVPVQELPRPALNVEPVAR